MTDQGAMPAYPEWRPIESAPSSTVLLLWNGDFVTIGAKREIGAYKGRWIDYGETSGHPRFNDDPTPLDATPRTTSPIRPTDPAGGCVSTETWFWVGSYSQKIKPVHIERFSANSVWVDGRRKARFTPSQWSPADGYYPTWQEAKNALIAAAEAKVMQARNALQRANDELGNIKGLKP